MKLSMRKVFGIIMASLSLVLFIFSFIPHVKVSTLYGSVTSNLWDGNKAQPVLMLFCYLAIIAVYLLHLFGILKEKWVSYVNYATGYITISYLYMFFGNLDYLYVGIWLGLIFSLGLATISVLWNFVSDKPFEGNGAPVTGYDTETGKPIYAKPTGFDPKTGEAIYEEKK